ncbi:hypothetical protein FDECE_10160 [Fusarium decemcellulare]|nr:hypothetical protein FDECE_10160 [Fusarium decemcellulare]
MQIKTLSLVAATAATAAASVEEVKQVNVVHKILETVDVGVPGISLTPNKRSLKALFRRASDDECESSVMSLILDIPTPTNKDVLEWITTMETTNSCTLTAPTTISDEVLEYLSELAQWSYDKEADAQEILDECNVDTNEGAVGSCGKRGKILFTDSDSTKTVALSSAIPTPTAVSPSTSNSNSNSTPTSNSAEASGTGNAAAPRGAAMGAVGAAAVGVVGVVMAL